MMRMILAPVLVQTLGQELRLGLELTTDDGVTNTIFPEIEDWIKAAKNRQLALAAVGTSDRLHDYRCFMDYLVCQIFYEIRPRCFNFYNDQEPQLKDILSLHGRDRLAMVLAMACETALLSYELNADLHWKQVRKLLEMQPEWARLVGVRLLNAEQANQIIEQEMAARAAAKQVEQAMLEAEFRVQSSEE